MARSLGRDLNRRIVISVNLPEGLYRQLLELLETQDYVHMSDLIRQALRFYILYMKDRNAYTPRPMLG